MEYISLRKYNPDGHRGYLIKKDVLLDLFQNEEFFELFPYHFKSFENFKKIKEDSADFDLIIYLIMRNYVILPFKWLTSYKVFYESDKDGLHISTLSPDIDLPTMLKDVAEKFQYKSFDYVDVLFYDISSIEDLEKYSNPKRSVK